MKIDESYQSHEMIFASARSSIAWDIFDELGANEWQEWLAKDQKLHAKRFGQAIRI